MAIQEQNIVFLQSQVMDDVPEGGGAAVNVPIVDGQANNVFEDISDLDRAYGRFNLRKLFLAVRTLSTDLYGGAKTVITALPQDPAISYTLFSTNDPFDTRQSAAEHVQNYLVKAYEWVGVMYGNHLANMRTLTLLQRVGSRLPPIGKTLCIVQHEGLATEIEQYVRIIDVDLEPTTFEYWVGDTVQTYRRWVVRCTLSDPLRYDFTGHEPKSVWSYDYTDAAMIRDTFVADAAAYYGTVPLREDAHIGDYTVRAQTVYSQLVPSAETEVPHVDLPLLPAVTTLMSAGARMAEVTQQAHTMAIEVTTENRRVNWVHTLNVMPAPGTLSLAYMALGNWYELHDDGTGAITADDAMVGTGTLNYETGTFAVTLGALPDADSQIVITWGSPAHYAQRIGAEVASAPEIHLTTEYAIQPGTLTITWNDGTARTAAVDAAGAITGDATGYVRHSAGEIVLRPVSLPAPGTQFTLDYQQYSAAREAPALSLAGATGTFSLGTVPVEPGSAVVAWRVMRQRDDVSSYGVWRRAKDDGSGGLVDADTGASIGTINYTTGACSLTVLSAYTHQVWKIVQAGTAFAPDIWGWGEATAQETAPNTLTASYAQAGTAANTHQESAAASAVAIQLAAGVGDTLSAGSLALTLAGHTYIDRDGSIYRDTGVTFEDAGILSGTVDYDTRAITLTDWAAGTAAVDVTSMLTRYGQWTATEVFFRTNEAPLKAEAFQLVGYLASDGTQISATPDADGNITTPEVIGAVNYALGFGLAAFAQPVVPDTLRYNAVSYSYLPLNADILGVDPVRLPSNGRVPIYRPGNVVLVMHTAETAPQTVASDGSINLGRTRIAWVRVLDATGATVTEGYTLDRANGVVTFGDVTGLAQPLTVRHTVADLRMATDVQITGHITLSRPLTHDFPADETLVASCLIHGDRRARVADVWDQASWNGVWSDEHGTPATATLNLIDHPIQVTNEGCDTDRWILRWTSTTNVELLSEQRGLIWSGTYTAGGDDIAPINPRTRAEDGTGGVPYLVIPGAANGGGWQAGNIVRINTVGAIADLWIARAIQQSDEPLDDGEDGCEIYALGNVDRP